MGIRFLLVLVAGLLVAAKEFKGAPKDDDKVVTKIEKLGGTVSFQQDVPGRPVDMVYLGKRFTDKDLDLLRHLPTVRRLDLSGKKGKRGHS